MVRQLLVPLLCAVSAAVAQPVHARDEAEFNLFAYGHGLGGLPVVERDGAAYIIASPLPTNCQNVTFRSDGATRSLAARIGSGGGDAAGAASLFAVPKTPGPVGFARDASNVSLATTGFGRYDSFLYLDDATAGGSMRMDWFARPVPDAAGTWELGWQLDGDDDAVHVALRDVTPSQ